MDHFGNCFFVSMAWIFKCRPEKNGVLSVLVLFVYFDCVQQFIEGPISNKLCKIEREYPYVFTHKNFENYLKNYQRIDNTDKEKYIWTKIDRHMASVWFSSGKKMYHRRECINNGPNYKNNWDCTEKRKETVSCCVSY